jgi:phage FluMu protein Com
MANTRRVCTICGFDCGNEHHPFSYYPEEESEVSKVKCDICDHTWIAVRPSHLTKLECPKCKSINSFDNITTTN